MERMLSQASVESKSASHLSTLKGALGQLGMTSLDPESVDTYKRERLEQMTHSLCPHSAREITEEEFSCWERAELRRMCKNNQLDGRPRIRFRDRLHKQSWLDLPGDAPVIRFWDTPWGPLFYTCLRWVRVPLEEVRNVPEFVKAKASEIANLLGVNVKSRVVEQNERRNKMNVGEPQRVIEVVPLHEPVPSEPKPVEPGKEPVYEPEKEPVER